MKSLGLIDSPKSLITKEYAEENFSPLQHTHSCSDVGLWSISTDLDNEKSNGIVSCNSTTLNTPYQKTLTTITSGTCSIAVAENCIIQRFQCNGSMEECYERVYKSNSWSDWTNSSNSTSSVNSDYAEIIEWSDGNTTSENRVGYFVSVETGVTMTKSTSRSLVRGVTVSAPGFIANSSNTMYDSTGNLLPKYSYVVSSGIVSVKIDSTITESNVKCIPSDEGIATLSKINYGYPVVDILDETHALILVSPNTDVLHRLADNLSSSYDPSEETLKFVKAISVDTENETIKLG